MNHLGSGQFTFLNLQDLDLSSFLDVLDSLNKKRTLDGNPANGSVQLVRPNTPDLGTYKWLRSTGPDDSIVFNCLGVPDGPRYLDGFPGPNTVQLQPNNGFLGTRSAIETPS